MSKFKKHMINLIKNSGGEVVEDLFVTKPGVKILSETVKKNFSQRSRPLLQKIFINLLTLIQIKII
jgi:hypothetical protein